MNHLLNVLDGFASVVGWPAHSGRAYVAAREHGFEADQKRLRGDVVRVGSDIKKSAGTYGEQGVARAGYQQRR